MNIQKRDKLCLFACFVMGLLSASGLDAHNKPKRRRRAPPATAAAAKPVKFSYTLAKYFDHKGKNTTNESLWEQGKVTPFNELILSWNALRPESGKMTFWVSVKHNGAWSRWHRLAEWGAKTQRTFVDKRHPIVHTKHVRVEMQKNQLASGFRTKITFQGGAQQKQLKALFACLSNLKNFRLARPKKELTSVVIQGVPQQSQMVIDHPRYKDFCSPTSTSMIVNYFLTKRYGYSMESIMHDYVLDFADKVHDKGDLDIYGNWLLNVAHAYHASNEEVFYKVERLNGFNDLYACLSKKIPVAVSVRSLRGGAKPYRNGHILVVVGWNKLKNAVVCVDPAFEGSKKTLKLYKLWDFLRAWGRSQNLSYVPIPT